MRLSLFIRAFIYFLAALGSIALPELSPSGGSGPLPEVCLRLSLQWLSLLRSMAPGRLTSVGAVQGPIRCSRGLCSAGSVSQAHGLVVRGHDLPRSGVGTSHWQRILCHQEPVLQCFFFYLHIRQMFIEHVAYLPGNSLGARGYATVRKGKEILSWQSFP